MSLPTSDTSKAVSKKGSFSKKPRLAKLKKSEITPIRLYPKSAPPPILDFPSIIVQRKIRIVRTCLNGADYALTTGDVYDKLSSLATDDRSKTIRVLSIRAWNITHCSQSSNVILAKPEVCLVQPSVTLGVYSGTGTCGEPACIGFSLTETMKASVDCAKGSSEVILKLNCNGNGAQLVEDQYVVVDLWVDVL